MDNNNYRGIPTSLFLNGPRLGIVTDPQNQTSSTIGFATFTGIATASFPNPTDGVNDGSIEFKWYFGGSQILDTNVDSNSNASIVGFSSATGTGSTITISGLEFEDDGKEVYFTADYVPSAYQTTSPVTAGTARSTGNAYNEPLQSSSASLEVQSQIIITKQPEDAFVSVGQDADFSIEATAPTNINISYQWQLNGIDLPSNGSTNAVPLTQIGGSNGVGVPVCISVIDECSQSQSTMDSAWSAFRNNYPQRRFYLLHADADVYDVSRLKIPVAYNSDALANAPIPVIEDNGNASLRSDWFELCQLDTVPSGTTISLSVDNSGSMTTQRVRESLSLFETKCSNAGLVLSTLFMEEQSENWVLDHNRDLPTISSTDQKIKITNDADSELFTLDLNTDVVYDSFVPGITYTLIPENNISVKLFATGASGGKSRVGTTQKRIAGGVGGSSEGLFTFVKDQEYKLRVGGGGADDGVGGFSGGGQGSKGPGAGGNAGGGGGGYTGLFSDSVTIDTAVIIAGGGGGGANDPAFGGDGGGLDGNAGSSDERSGKGGTQSAGGAGGIAANAGGVSGTNGSIGEELQGGIGAGGGGGGYYGGGGGGYHLNGFIDGAGGGGSGFLHPTLITDGTTTTGETQEFYPNQDISADGSFRIEFDGSKTNSEVTVSGATTPNLKILSSFPNVFGILKCKLTASNVTNSPLFSRSTEFVVVSARDMLGIETYNYNEATATIDSVDLFELNVGSPVCVSVIDEVSRSASEIDTSWTSFRGKYPNRPFYLLQPTGFEPPRLKIPTAYDSDPLAYAPITVNRDYGITSDTSDWFNLMNFSVLPSGTTVSLAIDESGSTTISQVQASLTLFEQRCSAAGLVINQISMEDPDGNGQKVYENWVIPHDRELPGGSSGLSLSFESHPGNAICLYAIEKDINVEIDMYGGKGVGDGISNPGGEGGYSRIRFTMKKDEEYVLTGLFDLVNAPFLYRKATLIAVVGGGGDWGTNMAGGAGGGINLRGDRTARAGNGGFGGPLIEAGTLPSDGIFGDRNILTAVSPDTKRTGLVNGEYLGGRTIPCTRGVYWRNQGKSPCEDLGTIKFRTPDGTEISNTAEIDRGYKSGYNIIQTSSGSLGPQSINSGSGATGGSAGQNGLSGGGGSGYTDGSVTVVSTQVGGGTGSARIIIRSS